MGKEPVNIRCSPDTIETVEQYADENDLGKSEAYRRVIREGVMLHGYDLDVPEAEQVERHESLHQRVGINEAIMTVLLAGLTTLNAFIAHAVGVF
mgnify:CR=1 FL=1